VYPFNEKSMLARTIGAQAERIDAGKRSPLRQDSASYIFHAHKGQGYTELGDGRKLHWKSNDTFVIPSWVPFTHYSTGSEAAYLFSFNDIPVLEALGLYRST
jgi:gentisate 1,2-dioxygenase